MANKKGPRLSLQDVLAGITCLAIAAASAGPVQRALLGSDVDWTVGKIQLLSASSLIMAAAGLGCLLMGWRRAWLFAMGGVGGCLAGHYWS